MIREHARGPVEGSSPWRSDRIEWVAAWSGIRRPGSSHYLSHPLARLGVPLPQMYRLGS